MNKSSVSRTRRFTYFQILCYALERWTRTHNQILSGKTSWRGSRVHHNTQFWTQLVVNQWNSSGKCSQDSPHCSSATKSKSSCQKWAKSQNNLQDGSSSCRCSTTSHGVEISRQWTGMRIKRQPRFYVCEKIFIRKMVIIPRTWIRKEVVFYSW